MSAPIYTHALFQGIVRASSQSPDITVPPGMVHVLRDIQTRQVSGTTSNVSVVRSDGIILFNCPEQSASVPSTASEMRVAIEEGTTYHVYAYGGDNHVSLTGYTLGETVTPA